MQRIDTDVVIVGAGAAGLTAATELVKAGVLTKESYQDNPPRYEYLLTDMGHDLFPPIAAILAWGDRWLGTGDGPPVELFHRV